MLIFKHYLYLYHAFTDGLSHALDEVLREAEDTNRIVDDLRHKIMKRVSVLESAEVKKEEVRCLSYMHISYDHMLIGDFVLLFLFVSVSRSIITDNS